MSSDEYLSLEDDGFRYELIDGVVVMTPSSSPEHQDIRGEIESQLRSFVEERELGIVLSEIDVKLSASVVYKPDLVFLRSGRFQHPLELVDFPPDLVVEVLSPRTAAFDQKTKLQDYQKFGVAEYWIIDPFTATARFLRLNRGIYLDIPLKGERFGSEAVPGFVLDLTKLDRVFKRYRPR